VVDHHESARLAAIAVSIEIICRLANRHRIPHAASFAVAAIGKKYRLLAVSKSLVYKGFMLRESAAFSHFLKR
jgi:hypothetical protein